MTPWFGAGKGPTGGNGGWGRGWERGRVTVGVKGEGTECVSDRECM